MRATILLVDDDQIVREYCNHVLAEMRYVFVLLAHTGAEAIDIADRYPGTIELLVSDIEMPGEINGVELAERVAISRPGIGVLLMSGCEPATLALKHSWQFLAKPFRGGDLVSMAEAILEGRRDP